MSTLLTHGAAPTGADPLGRTLAPVVCSGHGTGLSVSPTSGADLAPLFPRDIATGLSARGAPV